MFPSSSGVFFALYRNYIQQMDADTFSMMSTRYFMGESVAGFLSSDEQILYVTSLNGIHAFNSNALSFRGYISVVGGNIASPW